jgi:hypothetical protein
VNRRDWALGAAVALNLFVGMLHGVVHAVLPVSVPAWQYAVAGLTMGLLPLFGLALLRVGRSTAAILTVGLAGLTALAFEGLAHFVVSNPDHVARVPEGTTLFAGTAALSSLGDVLLVATAGWYLFHSRQGRVTSATESST